MKIVMSLIIFLALPSFAESNPFDNLHVNNIRAQGHRGVISFVTSEVIQGPATCVNKDHYAISTTEGLSSQMLSILLSAAATGKTIGINVDTDPASCIYGRPKVFDVWINY